LLGWLGQPSRKLTSLSPVVKIAKSNWQFLPPALRVRQFKAAYAKAAFFVVHRRVEPQFFYCFGIYGFINIFLVKNNLVFLF